MKRSQMMISFGAYDDDVYDFLQKEKNASALIRRLVRTYMGATVAPSINTTPTTTEPPTNKESEQIKDIKEEVSVTKSEEMPKISTPPTPPASNDKKNNAMQMPDL